MNATRSKEQIEHVDVVIVGGGVAGLWIINRLLRLGYNAVLISNDSLGSGQTIASQGIIHGGLKYTINNMLGASAKRTHLAKLRWQACLSGRGEINLKSVKLLSKNLFLWSANDMYAKLSVSLARYLYAGKVSQKKGRPPPALNKLDAKMPLYHVNDYVIDTTSLLTQLAAPHEARIHAQPKGMRLVQHQDQVGIRWMYRGKARLLLPKACVLAAGIGNEALLRSVGQKTPRMQRRPLRQLIVRAKKLPAIYGHYLDGGSTPLFTVSTHYNADGEKVWYVGGKLAEPPFQQRKAATLATLAEGFNRPELKKAELRHIDVDRAEPYRMLIRKPGQPYLHRSKTLSNLFTAWPVKLTMSPFLADDLVAKMKASGIEPSRDKDGKKLPTGIKRWPKAKIAAPPWHKSS